MSRRNLTDHQWEVLKTMIPGKAGDPGRTGNDNRLFLDAVLWMARTGAPTLGLHYPDTDRLAPALAALGAGITDMILSSADTSAAMLTLSTAAEFVATRNDPELISLYLEGPITAARTCANRYRYPVDASCLDMNALPPANLAALILETLVALSKRQQLADAVSFLAEGLLRLGEAWPQAAPIWRRVVSVVYDQLPPAVEAPLWRTWLRLRALP